MMEKQLKDLTNKLAVDVVATNKKCAPKPWPLSPRQSCCQPCQTNTAQALLLYRNPALHFTTRQDRLSAQSPSNPKLPGPTAHLRLPLAHRYEAVEEMRRRMEVDFSAYKRESISRIAALESQLNQAQITLENAQSLAGLTKDAAHHAAAAQQRCACALHPPPRHGAFRNSCPHASSAADALKLMFRMRTRKSAQPSLASFPDGFGVFLQGHRHGL